MTRRSCAIYATVVGALIVMVALIAGIVLAGTQAFQTMIHERLKKVSCCLFMLVPAMSRALFTSPFLHLAVSFCRCFTNVQHPDDSARLFHQHVLILTHFHIVLINTFIFNPKESA